MDSRLDWIALPILICNSARPLHTAIAVYITVKFIHNPIAKCINSIKSRIQSKLISKMKYNWFPIKFNNAARFLCHCVIVSKLYPILPALEIHSRHNDSRKRCWASQAIPTPLKILRAWFWLRRLKFSKLEERKGAIPCSTRRIQTTGDNGRW